MVGGLGLLPRERDKSVATVYNRRVVISLFFLRSFGSALGGEVDGMVDGLI